MAVIDLLLCQDRFDKPWEKLALSPSEWLQNNSAKLTLNNDQVIAAKTGLEFGGLRNYAGVYILFNGDDVMYVGQSMNCFNRVGQHKRNKLFRFDGWVVITGLPSLFLEDIEAYYINLLHPVANGSYPNVCGELLAASV